MKFSKCLPLVILFYFSDFTAKAQQSDDPGYILSLGRDTVRGYIRFATDIELTKSVYFKSTETEAWKEYLPAALIGFGIDKDVYKSLRFVNTFEDSVTETAFVKQIVAGVYNLYYYRKADRNFFLVQKEDNIQFLYDQTTSNRGDIIKEGNYLNYLNFISISCDKLAGEYERTAYDERSMAVFVNKVDNCISGGSATILYHKSKFVVFPVIFVGGWPVSGSSQFTANLNLRFTLPRVDNHFSINLGINFNDFTKTTDSRAYPSNQPYMLMSSYQIFSVPVTFQYNITTTRIRPYLYAGFSGAYKKETNNSRSVYDDATTAKVQLAGVLGIGIEGRIVSGLFVRADWRYEVLLQNVAVGLAYRF